MKTFEEALEVVSEQDVNLLSQNLLDGKEWVENDRFRTLIQSFVDTLMKNTMELQEPADVYALSCATLHGVFQFGLLVGMEMKKVQGDGTK